jgi:hypothetical protein
MTDLTGLRKFLGEPTTITLNGLTVGTLLRSRQAPVHEEPRKQKTRQRFHGGFLVDLRD